MKPRKYGPFPYSPIISRPKLAWPNGAHLALLGDPQHRILRARREGAGRLRRHRRTRPRHSRVVGARLRQPRRRRSG